MNGSTLPQWLLHSWSGYSTAARDLRRIHAKKDALGLFAIFVLYLLLASWFSSPDVDVPEPPFAIKVLRLALAAVGAYCFYAKAFCTPWVTEAEPEGFACASGPAGRWIFLTHQTVAFQAVHLSASLVASSIGRRGLLSGTYGFAVVLGGLGVFVTVQFFLLVCSTAEFKRDCVTWAERGVPSRFIEFLVHVPPAFLAIFDVCLVRHRASLRLLTPSCAGVVGVYCGYVAFYFALVIGNFAITGHWPYGMLKSLEGSLIKWGQFMLTQGAVLSIFAVTLWMLCHYTPAFW